MINISKIAILLSNADSVISYITENKPRANDLEDFEVAGTGVFQDTYTLFMRVGLFGAVIMIICGFIALMIPTNGSQEKAQAKKKIEWILVGVFLLCMAVLIIGWIYQAGDARFAH